MPDLKDQSLYFNRELSWLDFNQRVLELAEDETVPLLERVKFCAIYASNLDEFFMVRVAGLWDQVDAGIDARGPDGLSPKEQIQAIRSRSLELDRRLRKTCARRSPSKASASPPWTSSASPSASGWTGSSRTRSSRP